MKKKHARTPKTPVVWCPSCQSKYFRLAHNKNMPHPLSNKAIAVFKRECICGKKWEFITNPNKKKQEVFSIDRTNFKQ